MIQLVLYIGLFTGINHLQAQTKDSLPASLTIHLGDSTDVKITALIKKPLPGILFVHVHEDEKTAVQATTQYLDSTQQGTFITLQHGMGRNIRFAMGGLPFQFDPNRIYTEAGRKSTLSKFGVYSDAACKEVTKLSNAILSQFVEGKKLLVALHNNSDKGGLSILSYQKGGVYANDASKVAVQKNKDADDFFYTTSERAFQFFKKKGFNVMLQNNATVFDDGSLSVYAGNMEIDYINLEAQQGHLNEQRKMLNAATEYIKIYFPEAFQK